MNSFLERLMYENTQEMKRLIKEGKEASEKKNLPLLKLKMAGLRHAMDVGVRLIQIRRIWDESKVFSV